VALAILLEGWDSVGDLLLGEANLQRAQQAQLRQELLGLDERVARYPQLANSALSGDAVGSSAGGEQPKFAIRLRSADGCLPVIVKFSDRANTPAGQRWADLLQCEQLAGVVLREHQLPAAHSEIVHADGRCFLQSTRFDRTARGGRCGVISLAALDAAYYAHGRIDWWRWAPQLVADGWLDAASAQKLSRLGWFGALIGNTDMHLRNAALLLGLGRPLQLAPAYDMLPMRYSPRSGEVFELDEPPPIPMPTPEQREDWQNAARMATQFWAQVQQHPDISAQFKRIAQSHGEQVLQWLG